MPESQAGGAFFESSLPEPPSEIFGLPSQTMLELSESMKGLTPISPRLSADGRIVQGLIYLFPILEKAQRGEQLQADDMRPYRGAIKQVVDPLVEEVMPDIPLTGPLGAVGKVILGNFVEREFSKTTSFALGKARSYIPRAEPYKDLMAGFDNPRQQFMDEVSFINDAVWVAIEDGKPKTGALNAATALNEVLFENIFKDTRAIASTLPMLSGFLSIRNKRAKPMPQIPIPVMSQLAPGILMALGASLPPDEEKERFIQTIRNNPVRTTENLLSEEEVDSFTKATTVLIPCILELLPTSGAEVEERFEEIKTFLDT